MLMHYRIPPPYYGIAPAMPSDADTAEILAELRELRAAIRPRRHSPSDRQPLAICRLRPDEIAALDAAAAQRGLSRSEFMRQCIAPVIGIVLKPRQPTPPGLLAHNRRKPISEHAAQQTRLNGADAAREAARLAQAAKMAYRAIDAATARPQTGQAMLVETTAVPIVPKLPKTGG